MITVGTELLLGQIVNTNAAEIGRRLAEHGFDHYRQTVVGDNLERLTAAVAEALGRAEAVIVTGGLGPTPDDLTREALAAVTGRRLVTDPSWSDYLEHRARSMGRDLPPSLLRMAQHPEGALLIPNPRGAAPGLELEVGSKVIYALPGVPRELLPMLDEEVLPRLHRRSGEQNVIESRILRTWGLWESEVAAALEDLDGDNPSVAFLASGAEITVRLTAKAADPERAAVLLDDLERTVDQRLGHAVFARDATPVENLVVASAHQRSWTIGVVEHATAGLVTHRLVTADAGRVRGATVLTPLSPPEEGQPEDRAAAAALRHGAEVGIWVGPTVWRAERQAGATVAVAVPGRKASRTFEYVGDAAHVRDLMVTAALHTTRLALEGRWW